MVHVTSRAVGALRDAINSTETPESPVRVVVQGFG